MITIWKVILAIIIASLSITMPIYYSYQNKKKLKKASEPLEDIKIKNFINKINEETRNKKR